MQLYSVEILLNPRFTKAQPYSDRGATSNHGGVNVSTKRHVERLKYG